ncbi:MAG: GAF and ANTAR domain-containing protein [Nocardioides sp.]|uniref:GAF and ANTAR domain-containing protein n=1 Tax=Nocardioides sp. TaxID=35761 RepID=UPI0039E233E3
MSTPDRMRALATLAAQPAGADDERAAANRVIDQALELLPDVDWVSLTIKVRQEGYATLAASDDVARQADALQYALDEGPCIEAADRAEWFRSGSVASDPRWPAWGPRAAELGIGSLLSVRLAAGDGALGALNMYARPTGRFDDRDEVDFAVLYGAHAAASLTAAREIEGLHNAISSRHVIGLAQGILMERFGLTVERSFDLLRRYSSESNVKLAAVAAELVDTQQRGATATAGDG